MKLQHIILLTMFCATTTLIGCKNDDEADYLAYLASQQKDEPQPKPDPQPQPSHAVVFNELDGNAKTIELYNPSASDIDISGIRIYKDEAKDIYVAPQGTTIKAHGFLLLQGNAADYAQGFTSGLSADKATCLQLFDASGKLTDTFRNPPLDPAGTWQDPGTYSGKQDKQSFGRFPDGVGDWYIATPTPGAPNRQGSQQIKW